MKNLSLEPSWNSAKLFLKLHLIRFSLPCKSQHPWQTCIKQWELTRPTEGRRKSKAAFSIASTVTYGINRNSRQGWAPLISRCMHNLSPVILVLILSTTNGWKVNFGAYQSTHPVTNPVQWALTLSTLWRTMPTQ